MMRKMVPGLLVCGLECLGLVGCSSSQPRALDASLFIPPSLAESAAASSDPTSTPGNLAAVQAELPKKDEQPKNAEVLPSSSARPFDSLVPLVPLQTGPVQASPTTMPAESAAADAATLAVAPVTPSPITPASITSAPLISSGEPVNDQTSAATASTGRGVYMTLGGVLAQVNNTAIYANQVLSPLKKEFAAKAREMDPDAFRQFAEQEIGKQLQEAIDDELYFSSSYRELSDDDKKLAEGIAMQMRQERVTAAGGSVERAKRQAAEQGEDFDESVKQEYRRIVHDLYIRRKIEPLIQVTADNMRDFYQTNVSKLYSEKDRAQFRVIKIDPAVTGSTQSAREKLEGIRERAIHGEDFAKLASTENDDSFLKGRAGNPCDDGAWMERDTYRLDEVEAALWKLEPGQVTPIVESDGALYIARLDAKQLGAVQTFEDQKVQTDIYNRLHQQQMADLWRKSKDESLDDRVVTTDDSRIQVAVDMAMQTYAMAH